MTIRIPDPKANTTTEAYLAYKAGYLEESELKPVLYEPYLHFDGWLAYWAGLVDYFPVKSSKDGKNLMPILPGKISYRGLDVTVDKDGTITLNGHTTGAVTIKLSNGLGGSANVASAWLNQYITDDVNGKCMSIRYVSGSAPASSTALRLYGSNNAAISQWYFQSNDQDTVFSTTSKASCFGIYANQNNDFNNYKFRVQLEDNPTPTDYIPYASVPEMLTDEEALVAYLSGVTDIYPEEIKDPYDVRIVGYLKYLVSARWGRPEYPVNNEEFYLSTMDAPHTSNETPSADIELDTSEGKLIDVKAYGDTFQQTYSGKNLMPYNTYDASNSRIMNLPDLILPIGTFTISFDLDSYTLGTSSGINILLYLVDENGDSAYDDGSGNKTLLYINSSTQTGRYSYTFTTKAITHKNNTNIRMGATEYDNGARCKLTNIQIEVGSTPTTYEQYVGGVPAPNPDYPQDVQVVTGEQSVWVHGKNLIDKTTMGWGWIRSTNGTIGGVTAVNGNDMVTDYIRVTGDTKYTASFANFTGSDKKIIFGFYAQDKSWISIDTQSYTSNYSRITTTPQNCAFVRIQFSKYDSWSDNDVTNANFMFEVGLTATAYEPYTSATYTVNLGSTELCKIGDYQDYIYKSGNDWYVHKETDSVTYDGSEDWSISLTYNRVTVAKPNMNWVSWGSSTSTYASKGFSNYVKAGNTGGSGSDNVFNVGTINVFIKATSVGTSTDVDTWKTWLGSHNLTCYSILGNATDTKITDATLVGQLEALAGADTYDGKTFIRVIANDPNLPALLKVEAYKY